MGESRREHAWGPASTPGVGILALALALAAGAACDGAAGSAAAPSPPAALDAVADAAADAAAPQGSECTSEADCPAGTWCGNGTCRECDADEDCDDGKACTLDQCSAAGRCESALVEGCCAPDATPEDLAASCGPPPAGVAPEDYWECTSSGECVVQATMSVAWPPLGAVEDAFAAPGAAAAAGPAGLETARGAGLALPAAPPGLDPADLPPESWLEAVACSGCLNPGGMNKRVNGSKCTIDAACLSGSCQGDVCVPIKGVGDVCDWPDECTSGFCAQGYCCSSACDGACDHCGLPAQEGTCGNGCELDMWRSEVQSAAVYESDAGQDLTLLVNVGWHPGGRTVPGATDTHIVDWGIINWFCEAGLGDSPEICDNVDNDCDGETDEPWKVGPKVLGEPCSDGVGGCQATGYFVCPVGGTGPEPVCSAVAYPGGPETCNDVDDDCDGDTDEGLTQPCSSICGTGIEGCQAGVWIDCTAPVPSDFPTYGDPCDGPDSDFCENGTMGCAAGVGFGCLEDPNGGIQEDCSTPDDDDCNGDVNDPGAIGCTNYWRDVDNDGFGVGSSECLCGPKGTQRADKPGDCDDTDKDTYPGAPEKCNGKDNDCDGDDDAHEPTGELGVPSYENGATTPGHPCLGVTTSGGTSCDMSGCYCGKSGSTWVCFVD